MSGTPSGIDYTSLKSVMDMKGVVDQPEAFKQIQLIERGALQENSKGK